MMMRYSKERASDRMSKERTTIDAMTLMRPGRRHDFEGTFEGRIAKNAYLFSNVRPVLVCEWFEPRMVFPASKTLDEANLEIGAKYYFWATIDTDGRHLKNLRSICKQG